VPSSFETLAAVDLGSNSFRLQIVRVDGEQFFPLDTLKDTVRLGAGLTADNYLDDVTQQRALTCLARFGDRLRHFSPDQVRVVGTNTLRVAKNSAAFIREAEARLGFPIEIIAGREEARLIYIGAAHSLPAGKEKRLVVDIGGGSTEFIIGSGMKPQKTESLGLGCVTYSLRYFPDGKLTKANFKNAELAARNEIQRIAHEYTRDQWQLAIGTSGTARSLRDILELNDYSPDGITRAGMEQLKAELLRCGSMDAVDLNGLRADRAPVLPGGLAIMLAVFEELQVETMTVTLGALRDGVLYDMLGRQYHKDLRDVTVTQFKRRYHVDTGQAERVTGLARQFYAQLAGSEAMANPEIPRQLEWAAKLHEIGLMISHSGYHKHSAYIVEQADMPGFSRREQRQIAHLVLAHKGSLNKMVPLLSDQPAYWPAVLALRLAVLLCRSRRPVDLPPTLHLSNNGQGFSLMVSAEWLNHNPLTAGALKQEEDPWRSTGLTLSIQQQA